MALSEEILSSKTILIVDDKTNNLQLLSKYLQKANYRTLIAQDGEKAIKTVKSLKPDLIILDIMMPKMDGFDVCRCLKADSETQDIPIIFMTALAETMDKVKGLKLGAVDYMTKPFNEHELLARIKTHLSLNHLLHSSFQEANQRKLLFEISDRIRQSLDLNTILQTATAEIRNYFGCDFVGMASLHKKNIAIKAYAAIPGIKINPQQNIPYDYFCSTQEQYKSFLKGHIEICTPQNTKNQAKSISLPDPKARLIVPILVKDINYTAGFFSSTDNTIFASNISII